MDNKMLKIFLFMVIIIIIILVWKNSELFTDNITNIEQIIKNSDLKNLRWDYLRDGSIIELNDMTGKLYKMAIQNKNLENIIKTKLIQIYGEIKLNTELKKFLLFNNLIGQNNLPIFINESDSVILQNEIKILLITMEKQNYNKIKNII